MSIYTTDKNYALVAPRVKDPVVRPDVWRKLASVFVTRFSPLDATGPGNLISIDDAYNLLDSSTVEAWGKLCRLDGGDTMHASEVVQYEAEDWRDATYIRVSLIPPILSD